MKRKTENLKILKKIFVHEKIFIEIKNEIRKRKNQITQKTERKYVN